VTFIYVTKRRGRGEERIRKNSAISRVRERGHHRLLKGKRGYCVREMTFLTSPVGKKDSSQEKKKLRP